MNWDIENMREDYSSELLDMDHVADDPIVQFQKWFDAAVQSNVLEPNAMTLATCNSNGKPAARIVLLKGIKTEGFLFYTNYKSRKGQEMLANANVALVFNWLELHRQVRIEGVVEKISPEDSTRYFQSRPRGSQIGAWSSPQSSTIKNREVLELAVQQFEQKFEQEEKIPRPDYWGGYMVRPNLIEFWQGRTSRLHDRVEYTFNGQEWQKKRLAP